MLIVFRGFQEVKTVRKEQSLRPQHNGAPPGRERDKGNCRPTIAEDGRQLRRCSGSSSTKRIKDSEEYSRRSHSFHGPFGLCSMFRSRRIPAKLTRGEDCAQKPEIALVLTRQLRNLHEMRLEGNTRFRAHDIVDKSWTCSSANLAWGLLQGRASPYDQTLCNISSLIWRFTSASAS
jgi:hypothetical protein